MDINDLLDLLEIEEVEEFSNFEDFATLIECDRPISYDAIFQILSAPSQESLGELVTGYFEDVTEHLPDDSIDLYTILDAVGKMMADMLAKEKEGLRNPFVDEFFRFKTWYTFGPEVHCTSRKSGEITNCSICEAMYNYRLEKLSDEKFAYDLKDCLDYETSSVFFIDSVDLEEEEPLDSTVPDYSDIY